MSINIKEIFKSDLDPNSANWWAKDKVDKLNFNFGQLSNGGIPGVSGPHGASGSTGSIGIKGEVGHQGETGIQGAQGAPVISLWKTNINGNQSTIFPTGMLTIPDYGPTRLIIGKANDGSVNSDYNIDQPWTGTLTSSAILYSNTDRSNFALDHYDNAGVLDSSFAHHKYFNNTLRVGTFGKSLIIQVNLGDTTHQLTTSANGAPSNQTGNSLTAQVSSPPNIKITDSLFQVNTETNFDVDFTSTNDFSYNNAATDKSVLISSSTNGEVIWKSKYEVFGALPVGSIMSIHASDFNNTNFHRVDTLYIEAQDGLLRNIYGRGRVDTPFEGWYLCNGQDWQLNDTISNEVPNLNAFNFDIDADGGNQTAINNGGDNTPIIIGGASITVDANYVTSLTTGPGTYEITTPGINTNDISTNFAGAANTIGGSTSSGYGITRMVHLINLGSSSLKWKASNTNNPIPTENITLSVVGTTAGASCSNTDQVYTWDGVGINWASGSMSGITLYSGNSVAPTGWYEKDNTSRYWSGTAFTQSQTCPTLLGYTLYYNDDVRGLNWSTPPTSGGAGYIIETGSNPNLLKFATEIKNMDGSAADAGWYRAGINNNQPTSYYRAYWDGTNIGFKTATNYVHYAGKFTPASTYSPQACSSQSDQIDIYYLSINQMPYSSNHLTNLYNNQNILLVNKSWADNNNINIGEYDLRYISSQNAAGSNYPWFSLVDNTLYANIDSSSRLDEPIICQP